MSRTFCYFLVLGTLFNGVLAFNANAEEEEVSEERKRPPIRKLSESEIDIDEEFEDFKGGPFFMPPWPKHRHFFGYEKPREMFRDFKDEVVQGSEKNVCEGDTGESVDGSVKLSFLCDDGEFSYSCYADNISGSYSVDIPAEVLGKSCLITVETISANDSEEDVEVDGAETTEEVSLDEDTTVEVDVE